MQSAKQIKLSCLFLCRRLGKPERDTHILNTTNPGRMPLHQKFLGALSGMKIAPASKFMNILLNYQRNTIGLFLLTLKIDGGVFRNTNDINSFFLNKTYFGLAPQEFHLSSTVILHSFQPLLLPIF